MYMWCDQSYEPEQILNFEPFMNIFIYMLVNNVMNSNDSLLLYFYIDGYLPPVKIWNYDLSRFLYPWDIFV